MLLDVVAMLRPRGSLRSACYHSITLIDVNNEGLCLKICCVLSTDSTGAGACCGLFVLNTPRNLRTGYCPPAQSIKLCLTEFSKQKAHNLGGRSSAVHVRKCCGNPHATLPLLFCPSVVVAVAAGQKYPFWHDSVASVSPVSRFRRTIIW